MRYATQRDLVTAHRRIRGYHYNDQPKSSDFGFVLVAPNNTEKGRSMIGTNAHCHLIPNLLLP